MTRTIYATFDGHVLTPEGSIDLVPNQRYLIHIEPQSKQKLKQQRKVLQRISERAIDLGVSDLSSQHDHYLYGIEKQ